MMNIHHVPSSNSVQLQYTVYTYIKYLQDPSCLEAPTTTMEERYHYSNCGVQVVSDSTICKAGPVWTMRQMAAARRFSA